MASNNRPTKGEARCHGGGRLLTNLCYPREGQLKFPCLFHPRVFMIRCSMAGALPVFLGLDPPNFRRLEGWPTAAPGFPPIQRAAFSAANIFANQLGSTGHNRLVRRRAFSPENAD